ncbi:MAG: hypothetical protein V3W34_20695 [Phycisphaerae bacterium]
MTAPMVQKSPSSHLSRLAVRTGCHGHLPRLVWGLCIGVIVLIAGPTVPAQWDELSNGDVLTFYENEEDFLQAFPDALFEGFENPNTTPGQIFMFDSPLDSATDIPPFISPGDIIHSVRFYNTYSSQQLGLAGQGFDNIPTQRLLAGRGTSNSGGIMEIVFPGQKVFAVAMYISTPPHEATQNGIVYIAVHGENDVLLGVDTLPFSPVAGYFWGASAIGPISRIILQPSWPYTVSVGVDDVRIWIPDLIEKGDFDHDGDVDVVDQGAFDACSRGPQTPFFFDQCHVFDFDEDLDIDFADWGEFQIVFTG